MNCISLDRASQALHAGLYIAGNEVSVCVRARVNLVSEVSVCVRARVNLVSEVSVCVRARVNLVVLGPGLT